jgi:hypothetical protein
VLHDVVNIDSSDRGTLATVKRAAKAAGLVQRNFRSLAWGASLWGEAVVNRLRTSLIFVREDMISASWGRENTWTLQSDKRQIPIRRQCLTCKNKGCVGRCRFTKPAAERTPVDRASAPPERTAVPRLYRSPAESVHWFVWIEDLGWFLFPAKLNGWAERCPAKNVSRQRLQRVPLRMAFKTGLIEAFEGHTEDGAEALMGDDGSVGPERASSLTYPVPGAHSAAVARS